MYDQEFNEGIDSINGKLSRYYTTEGLPFNNKNNIDISCLNKSNLIGPKEASPFQQAFLKIVNPW